MSGLIRKRKIAREAAEICNRLELECREHDESVAAAYLKQVGIDRLIERIGVKPMHREKSEGGTAELTYDRWREKLRKEEEAIG